jgi:hypothetical protein
VPQDSWYALSVLLWSERASWSGDGEVGERLLLRLLSEAGGLFEYASTTDELLSPMLLPEVSGVFEWDGSWNKDESLSSKIEVGISSSEMVLLPNDIWKISL